MRKAAFYLIALLPFAAHAEYHTVSWFVANPAVTQGVIALCHDNAGLAARNPNCINAEEAATTILQRHLVPHSPVDPAYWRANPFRDQEIHDCNAYAKSGVQITLLLARMCLAARMSQ